MPDDDNRLYLQAAWTAEGKATWIPDFAVEAERKHLAKVDLQLEADRQEAIDQATSKHNPLRRRGRTQREILDQAAHASHLQDLRDKAHIDGYDRPAPDGPAVFPMTAEAAEQSEKNDQARLRVDWKYEAKRLQKASEASAEKARRRRAQGTSFDQDA